MKKSFINFSIILSALIFMNACTVEKRLYRKGLNIELHAGLKNAKAKALSEEESINEATSTIEPTEKVYKLETAYTSDNAESDNITSDNNIQDNNLTLKVALEESKLAAEETNVQLVDKVSKTKKGNTIQTNVPKKFIVKQKNAPVENRVEKSKSLASGSDNDIIGIILCIIGLAPFGVMIAKGKGSAEYKLNLKLWLGGLISYIGGLIISIITLSFVGFIFVALGGLLLLASFIHGLVSILR